MDVLVGGYFYCFHNTNRFNIAVIDTFENNLKSIQVSYMCQRLVLLQQLQPLILLQTTCLKC